MAVNQEIKSHLAKLLATEDLVVENKKVETASFNVQTRVLTLPLWDLASGEVYDLLVGHEVGHALYTPNEDWFKKVQIPPQFVNVVEDARIEKLMKRRYPGISKTFYRGYGELSDDDFFQIADENVDEMNLADKANLYFKIGNFIDIKFNQKEMSLIEEINNVETFDEVLDVSKKLYEFCINQQETKVKFDQHDQIQQASSGGMDQSMTNQEMPEETESSEEENNNSNITSEQPQDSQEDPENIENPGGGDTNTDVKTMTSFMDSIKDLISDTKWDNVYAEIPALNLDSVIIPNETIHSNCYKTWSEYEQGVFEKSDEQFKEFKRSIQKEVNYLVKEFECRKSASAYARASVASTGVLNTSMLHTYKYNEDLFKKITVVPNGKNHGLILVLDWSGSMADVMFDTVKQLFSLVWFCKKVNIPFDVYAFTNDYPVIHNGEFRNPAYVKRDGVVKVDEHFSMMNLLTSSVRGKELEKQMLNIFRIAYYFSTSYYYVGYSIPIGMSLSGTPLNESIIALDQIIPYFKKKNGIEKVQCVILTDGEAPPLKYHKVFESRSGDEPFIGINGLGPNSFIRDRKTGNTYSLDVHWHEVTNVMLRMMRNRHKDVNFVGMRILQSRDAGSFIRMYNMFDAQKSMEMLKYWKKNRTISIDNSGYHKYFGISASSLNQSTEFEVKDDATKSQIKSAFVKSLRTKKMNKKVLGEFIELIA